METLCHSPSHIGNTWRRLSAKQLPIDPFNKSNIYSFPLLTSLKLTVFSRISKAEYVVNSGKLCILNLLKGSISPPFLTAILNYGSSYVN